MSLIAKKIINNLKGPQVLILGYAHDDWPEICSDLCDHIDIVEGSIDHCEHGIQRFKESSHICLHHCLFEEYESKILYDTVIAGSVIELFKNPHDFLSLVKSWMKPHGNLILTTPNRNSLHRRIGYYMGIERNTRELNKRAHLTGAVKLYDRIDLMNVLIESDLCIHEIKGMFLKPLSNDQMRNFDQSLLEGLMEVGYELGSDICKELIAICTKSAQ
jgi:2-polyprenyl-3-methyl-5-hydroxy-6-metoxy-1,4-benzoquinol methylase